MSETVELLAQVPLLRTLPADDLARFAARTQTFEFGPEHDVVEIGTPGRSLFLILDGTVRVLYPSQNTDFELARLGRGEFFGEMALLNDKPRSATVRTVDDVRVVALDKADFRAVVSEHPRLALELLEVMSVRIRNADEQISGLSDQAMEDPLTGLANRRAFRERMAQEIDRERRYGTPFSLILLDVDGFKSVNDTLGHDAGDALLIWVARILSEHTRASDVPFRVGGEDFAVLCPSTTPETARTSAARLVSLVASARTPAKHGINLTLSAGIASFPAHSRTFEGLQRRAQRGVERAKAEGRNRVAVADPEEADATAEGRDRMAVADPEEADATPPPAAG